MTDETTPTTKRPRMTPEERVKRDRERLEASERKAAEAREREIARSNRNFERTADAAKHLLECMEHTHKLNPGGGWDVPTEFTNLLELMAQGK